MKKWVIIVLIIVALFIAMYIYSTVIHPTPKSEPVGGVYSGKIIAAGQDPSGSTIFWFDNGQQLKVQGWYALKIGSTYTLKTFESIKGLTISQIILVKE